MAKLLEIAIKQLRDLPAERQDTVAARVLEIIEDRDPWADLPPDVQASQLSLLEEGLLVSETRWLRAPSTD